MVIFLPLLLTLLLVSALRGGTNIILLLPMLLTLGVGAVYVAIALRDGTGRKKDRSITVLPTNPLSRQVHSALRTQRPKRSAPSPSKGATPLRSRSEAQKWP